MMFLWILCAIFLSYVICKKKPRWCDFLWLLIPIENYGIGFAGAIIKPYMVWGLLIVLVSFIKRKTVLLDWKLLLVYFGIFFADILNGPVMASVNQHIIFMVTSLVMYEYCIISSPLDTAWYNRISDILVSMTIGYGFVFTLAWIFMSLGLTIPGIMTTDRFSDGIILGYPQFGGGLLYRLRGFTIDPNAVVTAFLPGFCIAIFKLMGGKPGSKVKYIITLLFYVILVFLTGSRMAQLFSIIVLLVAAISFIKKVGIKRSWLLGTLALLAVMLLCVVFSKQSVSSLITKYIVETYSQRASVTDEAGRFTIWSTNMKKLFALNKEWFGVGENQIQYYTSLGMPCHCTWLEWICGNGLFVGILACIWQLSPCVRVYQASKKSPYYLEIYAPLIITHIGLCICLTAVDHISNPSLLFFTIILHFMADSISKRHRSIGYKCK